MYIIPITYTEGGTSTNTIMRLAYSLIYMDITTYQFLFIYKNLSTYLFTAAEHFILCLYGNLFSYATHEQCPIFAIENSQKIFFLNAIMNSLVHRAFCILPHITRIDSLKFSLDIRLLGERVNTQVMQAIDCQTLIRVTSFCLPTSNV